MMDSGDSVSRTVPSWEGYALSHTILRLDLAGRDFTEYLMKMFTAEKEIGRDVKEKLCYIALLCNTELKSTAFRSDNQTHMLSDGNIITVAPNVFRCESVFPSQVSLAKKPAKSTTSSFRNMKCAKVMLSCGKSKGFSRS